MKLLMKSALTLAVSACLTLQASAAITINLLAGRLDDQNGSAVAAGTLIQLVNLGADGVFNGINVDDGSGSGFSRWVSGDDTLVTLAFTVNGVADPEGFTIAAAFDLLAGSDASAGGELSRVLKFDAADPFPGASLGNPVELGIRWFPGLLAQDFDEITLAAGQRFGQYTNQSAPSGSDVPWAITGPSGTYSFHPLGTTEIGGTDSPTLGDASFTVVPEPTAIGLSLIGAAGLSMLRRRRS